jgi:hypothetical protein
MTVRDLMVGLDAVTKEQIHRDFEHLRAEFEDLLEPAVVEHCLEQGLSVVHGAQVKEYVPLLVHRFARERLADMAHVDLWTVPPERC